MIHNKALLSCICLSLTGSFGVWAADTTAYDTDTIVVTAKRYETPKPQPAALPVMTQIQKQQSNMTVVTAKDIEKNNYTTAQEAIQHINGVSVNDQVAGGTASYVRLNGSDRVLVLVDGQSLANPQSSPYGRGTTDFSALPDASAIERIEVTKGSGSVKYGSGAVGGVINIITKKNSADTEKRTYDVNIGSWNTYNYSSTSQGKKGKTSWFIAKSMGRRGYMNYNNGSETDKALSDYQKKAIDARIRQQINDKSAVDLHVFHKTFSSSYAKFDSPSVSKKHQFVQNGMNGVDRLYNNVAVTYHFNEDTDMPGFLRYYNDYTTTNWDGRYSARTQGIQLEKGWHVGYHRITAGLEWAKDEGSNASAGYGDTKSRINQAAYVEDAMQLGKWTVTPGVRYDHNSDYGTHTTPRIAVNYKANDAFNVYGNWGRVFNAPRFNDLYYYKQGKYKGKPSISRGTLDILAETGYTQTLGFTYQTDAKTLFDVSVFRSALDNAIVWNRNIDKGTYYESDVANVNREEKRGMEITMNKTINDSWDYSLGYSYIRSRVDKGDGKGLVKDTTYNSNNRPNGYHMGLNFHNPTWTASLLMNAGTGRDDTYYVAGSYVTWDAAVSYNANTRTTIYAKVNNLTNKGYDMYYGWPEPGRFWQLGVKYTF